MAGMNSHDSDGVYNDAISEKDSEASADNSSRTSAGPSSPQQAANEEVHYFELEKKEDLSDSGSSENDEAYEAGTREEGAILKGFTRGDTIAKSGVNVLDKARLFKGQKNADKTVKAPKIVRFAAPAKIEIKPDTLAAAKINNKPKPTPRRSTSPRCEVAKSSSTPPAGPTATNVDTPATYDCIWPVDTPAREPSDSVYEFAKSIPEEGRVCLETDPNTSRHSDTYDVPVITPFVMKSSQQMTVEQRSKDPNKPQDKRKLHYLSSPVPVFTEPSDMPKWDTTKTTSTVASTNKGCMGGTGQAVATGFVSPHESTDKDQATLTSEYMRLNLKTTESQLTGSQKQRLREKGYGSLASMKSSSSQQSTELGDQDFDSDANSEDDVSLDWGSEFDDCSYQEELLTEGLDRIEAPDKPLPPKPVKRAFLMRPGRSVPLNSVTPSDSTSVTCLPVTINPMKHPPPELPPSPDGMTESQTKRRMIVHLIISSERSYLESLERIIKDYEKSVLEFIPQPKSYLRPVFQAMREIISHHKMFQIELAEFVRTWDEEEKIGDIFTASFSKTMLVNAYSMYVNNFSAAMDEIRTLQRSKQNFNDFLTKQEKLGTDRLSIFALMVKPVQRFPQFIMVLQDLIKYTPQTHHDRRALQLALTELENVAYKLNERKRQSEQQFQAQQTIQQLIRQKVQHMLVSWLRDPDPKRRLIRFDTVQQIHGDIANMKSKERRVILMNDHVLCVKVIEKEQDGYRYERLALRWMAKLRDLELKDTAVTPDMQSIINREPGKINIISAQIDKPEDDPFHLYADLSEMIHDYNVLGQVSGLLASLKRSYTGHGLTEELIHEVSRDLQHMIQLKDEQLRLVNSCSIILVDNSRSDKSPYVLQTQTAAIKQDWCVDFLMAKLALDKPNNPAWDGPNGSDDFSFDNTPAHFMKYLPVDVPKNYTKIRCAVSIFLNPVNSLYGIGIQHLWVCSSTANHGQVSVLSVHHSKPSLMESFKACNCDIMAAALVPGCGEITTPGSFLFAEDTVWIATAHNEILIFPVTSDNGVRRDPLAIMRTPAVTVAMKFVDERLFFGFDNGFMAVYSRNTEGGWNVRDPAALNFGTMPLKLHFVHEEDVWLSCANKLFVLEIDSLETKATHPLDDSHESPIEQVVKSGVGIWVSFHDSSVIKLFHIESMENLQEISVGSFVSRIRAEKLWTINGSTESMVVTSLAASKGLLWIGTSLGVLLTVPLPRLSDGVPLYRGRPSVSLHAHRGPVKFLIPLQCSSGVLELNRASSLRSTIRSRPSKRNLEREKIELEESEKRRQGKHASSPTLGEYNMEKRRSLDLRSDEAESVRKTLPHSSWSSSDLTALKEWEEKSGLETYEELPSVSTENGFSHDESFLRSWGDKNGNRLSMDDSVVAMRPKARRRKASERSGKSKTLSFRSELAHRIIVQSATLSRSEMDLTSHRSHEVEELYEILLEDEGDINDDMAVVDDTSNEASAGGSIYSLATVDALGGTASTSSTSTQPSNSSLVTISSSAGNSQPQLTATPSQPPSPYSLSPSPSSVAPSPSRHQQNRSAVPALISRARCGTFHRSTMRKVSSNAVIVLSGGDGYCDLNQSRSQYKTDDACVMLWLYKF